MSKEPLSFLYQRLEEARRDQRILDAVINKELAMEKLQISINEKRWQKYRQESHIIKKFMVLTAILWKNTSIQMLVVSVLSSAVGSALGALITYLFSQKQC